MAGKVQAEKVHRIGVAFAMQFYQTIVKENDDPSVMLDDDTMYTTGDGAQPASQVSVVGRQNISLDLEISVFRGKQLQLISVDTQDVFDEGLIVLVHGAAVDEYQAHNTRKFVQTFLLGKDPDDEGFFIRNTVIRFLEREPVVAVAPAAAAAAPAAAPAAVPVAAAAAPAPAAASATNAASAPKGKSAAPAANAAAATSTAQKAAAAPATLPSAGAPSGKPSKSKSKNDVAENGKPARGKKEKDAKPAKADGKKEGGKREAAEPSQAATPAASEPAPKTAPASFADAAKRAAHATVQPPKRERKEKPAAANAATSAPKKEGAGSNSNSNNNNGSNNSNNGSGNGNANSGAKAGGKKAGGRKERDARDGAREEKSGGGAHINPNAQCYVSNIAFGTTDEDLSRLLGQFGKVKSIVRPPSKGYGFVEFIDDKDARKAISNPARVSLSLDGRELKIEERQGTIGGAGGAREKDGKRAPRREGGGGNGGGGGRRDRPRK